MSKQEVDQYFDGTIVKKQDNIHTDEELLQLIAKERQIHFDLKTSGWIRWIIIDDFSE